MRIIGQVNSAFLALILCATLIACSADYGGSSDGTVIDASTLLPASDAIVIATWHGSKFNFVHPISTCMYIKTTTTDKNGKYYYPSLTKELDVGFWADAHQELNVYKYGYVFSGSARDRKHNYLYVEPFSEGNPERLGYLQSVIGKASCGDRENQKEELPLLYRRLYKEALYLSGNDENNEALRLMRGRMVIPWNPSAKSLLPDEAEIVFDKHLRPLLGLPSVVQPTRQALPLRSPTPPPSPPGAGYGENIGRPQQ